MALGMTGPAAAQVEPLPDSVQWICRVSDDTLSCWDTGEAGEARLVDQCGDGRAIDAEGAGEGLLVLRDTSHSQTVAVLSYSFRALLPIGWRDERSALLLWDRNDRALLRDGFESCRHWIR